MDHLTTIGEVVADHPRASAARHLSRRWDTAAAVVAAIIVGISGTAAVAAVAHSAGVSNTFPPLKTASYVGLIVVGVIAGGIGWQLVRARAGDPARVLRRLVPLVVLVSFVPDLAIGVTGAEQATWGGVFALMCAHVVVAAAAVASFTFFLPADRAHDEPSTGDSGTHPEAGSMTTATPPELTVG